MKLRALLAASFVACSAPLPGDPDASPSDTATTGGEAGLDAAARDGAAIDATTPDAGAEPSVEASIEASAEASVEASIDAPVEVSVPDAGCSRESCVAAGSACDARGRCVEDCRLASARACAEPAVCDFTDGRCRAPGPCVLRGPFVACGAFSCGPGTECAADGCVVAPMCATIRCEGARCHGADCPCERPVGCTAPSIRDLNRPEFAGASPIGTRDGEGIFDLQFDDVCTAYAVTVISGTDQLRQMIPDGTLTAWNSVSNLDMGEVAVLQRPDNRVGTTLGEVAATYICIGGCAPTGEDGQMGVIRLDRASASRPLPNVVPATTTTGSGPFGDRTVDAGPYGLVYARDHSLYVGNLTQNGDFHRVDLATRAPTLRHRFEARVHAAAVYDSGSMLVAIAGGLVFMVANSGGAPALWTTMPGEVTSLARDGFTGAVYAELRTTPPSIVEVSADGAVVTDFQRPPRLGRISIAPDGYLYHASVYPNVGWTMASSPPIVRWPLPATR